MENSSSRPAVLIVDDEPSNIELLNEILMERHRVLFATNGLDALKITQLQKPDLILLDILMPGMDGTEVCSRLKEDPNTKDIPVIFVTGMIDNEAEAAGLELGAVDYIAKPINPPTVLLRVKNQLELKLHRDKLEELVKERTCSLESAKIRAEAGNRAKDEFLMIMGHELRTPLNIILGYSDLLASAGLQEPFADYADAIQESGQSLLELINGILEYVKLDAGDVKLAQVPFSLAELFQEISATLVGAIYVAKLTYNQRIAEDVGDRVRGDKQRLRQILVQLLQNALKFTSQGSIELSVTKDDGENKQGWLHFAVRDTGIGISQENHDKIFDYFWQLESPLTRRQGGLGLGLAICKRFVSLLGGKLWLESQLNKGSTFHFSVFLPAEE